MIGVESRIELGRSRVSAPPSYCVRVLSGMANGMGWSDFVLTEWHSTFLVASISGSGGA